MAQNLAVGALLYCFVSVAAEHTIESSRQLDTKHRRQLMRQEILDKDVGTSEIRRHPVEEVAQLSLEESDENISSSNSTLGNQTQGVASPTPATSAVSSTPSPTPVVEPWHLLSEKWDHSTGASFANQVVAIPSGGWISSKASLARPTVVEAQIRSTGSPGAISMTLFATDHQGSSVYSVTTGLGSAQDEARVVTTNAADSVTTNADDNTMWHTVRIEVDSTSTKMFVNGVLAKQHSDNTANSGNLQFVAIDQPMEVKEVTWRRNCEWSVWIDGSCSHTCGDGTLARTRHKTQNKHFGGDDCVGNAHMTEACNDGVCPDHSQTGEDGR